MTTTDPTEATPSNLDEITAYLNRLLHRVGTLEQRIAAARLHIDRARAYAPDGVRTELVMALDVLAGEATA